MLKGRVKKRWGRGVWVKKEKCAQLTTPFSCDRLTIYPPIQSKKAYI
jgi:hypothetical protein